MKKKPSWEEGGREGGRERKYSGNFKVALSPAHLLQLYIAAYTVDLYHYYIHALHGQKEVVSESIVERGRSGCVTIC